MFRQHAAQKTLPVVREIREHFPCGSISIRDFGKNGAAGPGHPRFESALANPCERVAHAGLESLGNDLQVVVPEKRRAMVADKVGKDLHFL